MEENVADISGSLKLYHFSKEFLLLPLSLSLSSRGVKESFYDLICTLSAFYCKREIFPLITLRYEVFPFERETKVKLKAMKRNNNASWLLLRLVRSSSSGDTLSADRLCFRAALKIPCARCQAILLRGEVRARNRFMCHQKTKREKSVRRKILHCSLT